MDCKAFIEISKGSNLKYEFDKENQCLVLDRILHNSNVFPYNYGREEALNRLAKCDIKK